VRRTSSALLLATFAAAVLILSGGAGSAPTFAQCPEAPAFALLPANWTCPVIPKCGTQYGVCRWPHLAAAGQPCHCQAPHGAWIPGHITVGSPGVGGR
jgi:hypothetical protein